MRRLRPWVEETLVAVAFACPILLMGHMEWVDAEHPVKWWLVITLGILMFGSLAILDRYGALDRIDDDDWDDEY